MLHQVGARYRVRGCAPVSQCPAQSACEGPTPLHSTSPAHGIAFKAPSPKRTGRQSACPQSEARALLGSEGKSAPARQDGGPGVSSRFTGEGGRNGVPPKYKN
jgi:hypothetical protein